MKTLRNILLSAGAALAVMQDALKSPFPSLAIRLLEELGSKGRAAVPALEALMRKVRMHQREVSRALSKIMPER